MVREIWILSDVVHLLTWKTPTGPVVYGSTVRIGGENDSFPQGARLPDGSGISLPLLNSILRGATI